MHKPRILYIHVGLSSFVKKDIDILSQSFELLIFHFDLSNKKKLPLVFIQQFFFLIRHSFSSKVSVTQFAGYQSFLPSLIAKFTRKKSILILGGTDTVSFPSIKYGCFYNKYLKHFTSKSIQWSDLLLPVSENLIECDYTYTKDDFPKQGYKFHIPNVITPVKTIYNGYDAKKWTISNEIEELSFLTIGVNLGSRFGKKLKGIDLIITIASSFPQCKFYIVGGDKLNEKLPNNVIPIENMPHDDLPAFIANKQFYLQLSMSEGFPNALCEAMLSGCTPIVSNVGAMPLIVGELGFILEHKDENKLVEIIQQAIQNYLPSDRSQNRQQIESNFSLTRRTQELNKTIIELIKD